MRSVWMIMGVFFAAMVLGGAGCANILGLEPWEDKQLEGSSSSLSGGGSQNQDSTSESASGSGSMSSGGADPCNNGMQDGTETGVDCGGASCAACPEAHGCLTDADCGSGFCPDSRGYCVINDGRGMCGMEDVDNPTCADCLKNGPETDVDCGGECAPCRAGKICTNDTECWSGVCVSGLCAAGGPNTRCYSNADCTSGTCAIGEAGCTFESCCR